MITLISPDGTMTEIYPWERFKTRDDFIPRKEVKIMEEIIRLKGPEDEGNSEEDNYDEESKP